MSHKSKQRVSFQKWRTLSTVQIHNLTTSMKSACSFAQLEIVDMSFWDETLQRDSELKEYKKESITRQKKESHINGMTE